MRTLNDTLLSSEQAVIGSLIRDNDSFDEIELSADEFFSSGHRTIYAAIAMFLDSGKPCDMILLCEWLDKRGELENVGGLTYITDVIQSVNTSKNIKYHAKNIADAAKLRKVKAFIAELNTAVDAKKNPDELTELAESGLFNLLENKESSNMAHIGEAVAEAIDWEDSGHSGVKTGLRDLDWLTGGFGNSNLVIIAGRPSMGKSSLAMQIAEHVSKHDSVVVFSLEMSKREIASRLVKYHASKVGKSQAVAHLHSLKLHIDDKAAITLSHIRSQCRKIKRKHGLSMIVIDYLQLMQGIGDNRNQEIGGISRGLKAIAKEFDIPVIALSQLSRKVEERSDKRPVMSDLRESGEIEQDADMILFIYRDEVYNNDSEDKGLAEIICRKNRNGSIGDAVTKFNGQYTRFEDHSGERILRSVKPKERGFVI